VIVPGALCAYLPYMSDQISKPIQPPRPVVNLRARLMLAALITIAVAVVYFSNRWLTERYTETTRNRAELRVALYSGNLISELQRNSVVPLLLSRDPALINALNTDDFSQSTARLISYREEIEAASLMLLDADGRNVASTNRETLGSQHRTEPFFVSALRSADTVFTTAQTEAGGYEFTYSRKIEDADGLVGVIVVGVDLRKFEQSWAGISDAVLVTDSESNVILSTESRWRGKPEGEALALVSAIEAIRRSVNNAENWSGLPSDVLFLGDAVMRHETRVPFQGWRIASFASYASVREKVNAVLALEIMAFAMLLSLIFYLISRRAQWRSVVFEQESAELRQLNDALQREIAGRQRAEENLQVAEQTLAQSSNLSGGFQTALATQTP